MGEIEMRFEGKAALVTGAGSGIGRATAKGFAQRGGVVAVADINGDNANRVAAEITAVGSKAIAIVADVTKAADVEMMISRTTREFGRLDFLHNNAFGFAAMPGVSAVAATADTDDRM
jgi:NAD(P)-dependent dehydrogenase (short-subunit alcohol dehydrogenase family)